MNSSTPINKLTNFTNDENNNTQMVNEIISEMNNPNSVDNIEMENTYKNDQDNQFNHQINKDINMHANDNINSTNNIDESESKQDTINIEGGYSKKNNILKELKDPVVLVGICTIIFLPQFQKILRNILPKLFSNTNYILVTLTIIIKAIFVSILFTLYKKFFTLNISN